MQEVSSKGFLLTILFLIQVFSGFCQTDVEFWFVAPEITIGHGNFPGGEPVYFRVSALELDATVRIYQPANPAGMDTTFNVPARSTVSINASPWINDLENKLNLDSLSQSAPEPAPKPEPLPEPAPEPKSEPAESQATLFARCEGCGHKLAYKKALSGKRVRCPACRTAFALP